MILASMMALGVELSTMDGYPRSGGGEDSHSWCESEEPGGESTHAVASGARLRSPRVTGSKGLRATGWLRSLWSTVWDGQHRMMGYMGEDLTMGLENSRE